ncbi:MAG: hypothetical protein PHP26_05160 [Syntrophomonas sp.]|uniref:hypothetical protein n=1 Tax=Syntrophomonas sp. TaxID=2053627 RepID=UPI00261B1864|nr:hypothetical protein [Syntrophomonas sp.]MDD2509583.1 hypothetical protein [Syntrophomonas sp.]MDD3879363.1 hypothetical protein [Syntrophomonas sp.]MDD4626230.1 hypothetical protein [Syntrophomonas sp.]
MKKFLPLILSLLFIIMFCPQPVQAANVYWQIDLRDDGSIYESLTLDQPLNLDTQEWKQIEGGKEYKLERKLDSWQAYQALSQSLPIKAEVKNYVVFQRTSLFLEKESAGFLQEVAALNEGQLRIRIPGAIGENSADEVKDMTASWELKRLVVMEDGHKLLTATILDGFMLAVVLFGMGFLIIIIWFISRMKRVNDLIQERYSLENIGQEENLDEDDD